MPHSFLWSCQDDLRGNPQLWRGKLGRMLVAMSANLDRGEVAPNPAPGAVTVSQPDRLPATLTRMAERLGPIIKRVLRPLTHDSPPAARWETESVPVPLGRQSRSSSDRSLMSVFKNPLQKEGPIEYRLFDEIP